MPRIAIVDPGSFVLPYDYQLVRALAEAGHRVDFYGSTTRYNGEFLDAMRRLPGVTVQARPISSSVAWRGRGAWAYLRLLFELWRRAGRYDTINLQFSGHWPLERLVFAALERRLVYTVHNAVPHGHAGERHGPTEGLAQMAPALVFVSQATHDDFMRRYGEGYRAKASVLPHGLLPVAPQAEAVPYSDITPPSALVFWSTVKPYKGVELFADLARSQAIRQRGWTLAVHGAWSPELIGLREELRTLGVAIHDDYLPQDRLQALMNENAVFLLPYQRASQSGALYSLLHHGRLFLCTDTGDLGAFLRQHGLERLLLKDRSAAAVIQSLDWLNAHRAEVNAALSRAQQSLAWRRLLADFGQAYQAQANADTDAA